MLLSLPLLGLLSTAAISGRKECVLSNGRGREGGVVCRVIDTKEPKETFNYVYACRKIPGRSKAEVGTFTK